MSSRVRSESFANLIPPTWVVGKVAVNSLWFKWLRELKGYWRSAVINFFESDDFVSIQWEWIPRQWKWRLGCTIGRGCNACERSGQKLQDVLNEVEDDYRWIWFKARKECLLLSVEISLVSSFRIKKLWKDRNVEETGSVESLRENTTMKWSCCYFYPSLNLQQCHLCSFFFIHLFWGRRDESWNRLKTRTQLSMGFEGIRKAFTSFSSTQLPLPRRHRGEQRTQIGMCFLHFLNPLCLATPPLFHAFSTV